MIKAVFLDRDGTVIYEKPGVYLCDPQQVRLYKSTRPALQLLAKNGKNDVMTLSLSTNLQNSVEGIKAFVFENKGKKFIFSQTILSAAHERGPRGGYHCPNLVDLYENCMEYTYKRFNNSDKFNINLIG